MAYADLDRPGKAREHYQQSLELARRIGDRRGEANALGHLGVASHEQGETAAAIDRYMRALDIARQISHRQGECNQLHNLGEAWRDKGKHEWALACYLTALGVGQAISDPRVGSTQESIAELRQQLGEQEFAGLFQRVEPNKERIVQEMLQTIAQI